MVCFWMKPEGSHYLSVHLWHASLPLSAPHLRKPSSLLWSSEFLQPLPCVSLDGVTWRTGTGWCRWPCGEQKYWLCCHLSCIVAHPGIPAVRPSPLLLWTWLRWSRSGVMRVLGSTSRARGAREALQGSLFHILHHQGGNNHRHWGPHCGSVHLLAHLSSERQKGGN